MSAGAVLIRPYRASDREALDHICVATGLGGGDARGHYTEPELLPVIFARPYAALEPELVFVAEDDGRAIGYVLGTADSAAFFRAFRERWLPQVAGRFPAAPEPGTPDERLRDLLHHPERMLEPAVAGPYPAHLHIDLLPEGQGRGLGRRLMETFLDALRARDVPGVHLGVSAENTRARAFYQRLGFTEAPVTAPSLCLVRRL